MKVPIASFTWFDPRYLTPVFTAGSTEHTTGMMLAQVITHHKAVISVEQHEITTALIDDKWDMIMQKEAEWRIMNLIPAHSHFQICSWSILSVVGIVDRYA